MKWQSFLHEAFPEERMRAEREQNIVFRANRWIGLRVAYVVYHLGVSANFLSVIRLLLALGGFYLVSRVTAASTWLPLVGAAVLAFQIHLDFVDGAVARIRGQMSRLGEKLDYLPNAASRMVALLLAGFFTGKALMFLIGAFAAYVLVVFAPESELRFRRVGIWHAVSWLYRLLLYVPVMAFLLPLALGAHGVLQRDPEGFSTVVISVYGGLAIMWLLLLLWKVGHPASPFESTRSALEA